MKIAITSASGQLGAAIVKQLIKEIGSENVIGIARTPTKAEHLGVEVRKGDPCAHPSLTADYRTLPAGDDMEEEVEDLCDSSSDALRD